MKYYEVWNIEEIYEAIVQSNEEKVKYHEIMRYMK